MLQGSLEARGVHAVVIGGFGSRIHVYCSNCPAKLSLDGQPAADIGTDGLELPGVSPGPHQLALTKDGDQHTLDIDVTAAPSLGIFVESDQNISTLLILTREDKAQVFLNGKLRGQTRGGQLRIPNLEPRKYTVRVAKDGFQDVAEQQIEVKKGEQRRLNFRAGGHPESRIVRNSRRNPGQCCPAGWESGRGCRTGWNFPPATVNPGDHTIELRKDHFSAKTLQKHFAAGSVITLAGTDAALDATPGQLKITFPASETNVAVAKSGETPVKVSSGSVQNLAPGQYIVSSQTSDGTPRSRTVEVKAGELTNVDIQSPSGMADWDVSAGGWRAQNNWFYRRGGGVVTYRTSPTTGTFAFSACFRRDASSNGCWTTLTATTTSCFPWMKIHSPAVRCGMVRLRKAGKFHTSGTVRSRATL